MLCQTGAPVGRQQVAGLIERRRTFPRPAAHQPGVPAMLAGQKRDDGRRLAVTAAREHDSLIRPFHSRRLSAIPWARISACAPSPWRADRVAGERVGGAMRPRDMVLAALTSIIWGFAFVVYRFGLDGFSPAQMAALRFIIGALPILVVPRPRLPWTSLVLI